ncbi:hypothetical protein [Aerosakkonema funiforme]|uniref:hypothetical protein n=1 Tax=Aerosakkonema funiforme TaxID=1246630 RepID=UPI0035BAA9B1
MYQWSALSGVYEGSDFTCYGDEAWKCSFNLHWEDTGRVTGSGYLTAGEDFIGENDQERVDVVILGQMTQKGNLYGVMVAPNRFEKGVCWTMNLAVDFEKRELEGEVFYAEDALSEGELGSMFLKYQRDL